MVSHIKVSKRRYGEGLKLTLFMDCVGCATGIAGSANLALIAAARAAVLLILIVPVMAREGGGGT